jgi:integrase
MNNPFEGLKIRNTSAHVSGVSIEENDRRSFTPEELLQYEDILKTKKSEIKTIGLLMIWTGCRTMEIGGLLNNELLLDLNVPYLLIRPNRIRRLKTLASERKVPLTADALDILRDTFRRKITQHPMHLSFVAMGEMVVWIHFLKTSET